MSLADEFLADLEEENNEEDFKEIINEVVNNEANLKSGELAEVDKTNSLDVGNKKSIKYLTRLIGSDRLNNIVEAIKSSSNNESDVSESQLSKEYELIVQANQIMVDIENEINIIHKYLRDIYSKRFPELESLVTGAYDYIQTVHFLGNMTDGAKVDDIEFLTPALKMVVSVTISTTIGHPLPSDELALVEEACQMAADLSHNRALLFEYIQSRMIFIAPNLTHMIGPSLAAQLIGSAGGLYALAKMPACNTQLVGASKINSSGFSSLNSLPHAGILYHSEFIQKLPLFLRKKATRILAAKCTLAVRMDQQREHKDGSFGDKLMDDINAKIEKSLEPPPVKVVKALPRPDDFPKRRRGGKRQRRNKERIGLTELRKQANTIKFGQIQEDVYQTAVGFGVGAIGQMGTGKIRNAQLDNKTKVSLSKRLQKNLATMNSTVGTKTSLRSQISGTASTVAYTPMKGIEIVNPQAAADNSVADGTATARYFSSATGFKSTLPKP